MAESALLGAAGAAVGLVIAYWIVPAVRAITPDGSIPRLEDAAVNGTVLAFSLALAGVTGAGLRPRPGHPGFERQPARRPQGR